MRLIKLALLSFIILFLIVTPLSVVSETLAGGLGACAHAPKEINNTAGKNSFFICLIFIVFLGQTLMIKNT